MLTPFALEGRHARLEPLSQAHVPGLAAAAAEDRATFGFTAVPDGEAETGAYVAAALRDHRRGEALPWAVRRRSDGAVVGSTRFLDLGRVGVPDSAVSDACPPNVLEIGHTWYAASAQRTAVNTEVKLLLLTCAFDRWEALRVTLKTDARNARSRAAIERLGAVFEGVRRAHMTAGDGGVRDTAYYSITRPEWPAVRNRLAGRVEAIPIGSPEPGGNG
jgi:RimJ/RimL family protein N-acetyltransferase